MNIDFLAVSDALVRLAAGLQAYPVGAAFLLAGAAIVGLYLTKK